MDDIEILVSKQYPELFHYTNVSALENIFKTQQLWATHYEDLNDSSELRRFKLKVCEFIQPIIRDHFDKRMRLLSDFALIVKKHGGIDSAVREETERILDLFHSLTFGKNMYEDLFVISFCAHKEQSYEATNGLLSQWRGYGADGGVAIVLNTNIVEKRMNYEYVNCDHHFVLLGDVIYDNDNAGIKEKFNKVFELFPNIIDIFYSRIEPSNDAELAECIEKMHKDYVCGSARVKHHAFREEDEIRLLASPISKDSFSYKPNDTKASIEIRRRKKDGREVRYIVLFGNDLHSAIKRIIVGPSRFQELNFQTVNDIVKGTGIEVIKSEIPFLG